MALPTPLEFERAGLKCWPGIEVAWDGSWVRRASNGLTQRANSAQCFDAADDGNVSERIAAACRWFEQRGLPPIFRVNLLSGPALKGALDRGGWVEVDHSQLMATELGLVDADPRGEVLAVNAAAFLEAQRRLRPYDAAALAKFQAILAVLDVPAAGIVLYSADSRAVSSALMAVSGGIVITGNVVTDPSERRKGYGAAMMRTGLAWARQQGARAAALNVAADNPAGQALYTSLGYRRQYDYVYRMRGPA